MASPDVRPYVDLTLFDESAQSIYLTALDYARTALPEYTPREGTIESILLQAFAREVQQAVVAINRVPGAITEILLRLLDVERSTGSRATAVVKFYGQTTSGFTVPSGTRLYYQATANSDPLLLETTSSITGAHVKAISSISQSGSTTVTVTTSTRHGLSVGNSITISDTGVSALNISGTVATVDTTGYIFTITSGVSDTNSATTGNVTPANTIPATAFTSVQTTVLTGAFNGLAAESALNILSVVPQVASASLASTLTGGASAESDTDYFTRATSTLSRLSAALVTASQIEQYVIESGNFPDVYRVTVANNTNGQRVGNLSSHVMVAIAPIDSDSTNLLTGVGDGSITPASTSYGILDEVFDGINERIHSSLAVSVTHPAFVKLAVTAAVALPEGLSSGDVQDACVAVLESYLSSNTWNWSQSIRESELIVQLRNATLEVGTVTYPAVDYVSSVSVVPTDFYVPSTSGYNRFNITQRSRSSNVATITTSSAHGMTIGANETLYIKVANMSSSDYNTSSGGNYVVAAASASGSAFTYASTGSNEGTTSESGGYVIALAKYNSATGVLTLLDPAPLVLSDTHTVTAS
jgi:hypothetical protein